MSNPAPISKTSRWWLGAIIVAAVLVRLAAVGWTRSYLISPGADHFEFGYEAGRIARSLAVGDGFASPMQYPTGPTAYLAPGYPLILSAIFRLFGIYTAASAWAAYAINAVSAGLTCLVLFRLGSAIFGNATGIVAAALFAAYPTAIWFAIGTIWDVCILALCLPALLLWFHLLPADPPPQKLVLTGFWMGLMSLLNPVIATVGLVGLCSVWIRLRGAGHARYLKPATAAVVCFLVLLPWMVRNALVVGEFTPRGAAGVNLRQGNSELASKAGTGTFQSALNPADSGTEGQRMKDLGEAAYDRACGREAIEFIRRNPGKFFALTWIRFQDWWIGYDSGYSANLHGLSNLASWKRLLGSLWLPFLVVGAVLAIRRGYPVYPLLATILLYPLPYYATIVSVRYRFPIEPLILIFLAYCLVAIWNKPRKRSQSAYAPAPQIPSLRFDNDVISR
jgi:4-amino-4-deoxy-L-arabinose transferase-like glycosyltransferase